MMKKIKMAFMFAKIEFLWWLIKRQRQKGRKLLDSGLSYSSPQIIKLNQSFSKRCMLVMKTQKEYEKISGIHKMAVQKIQS